MKRKPTTKQAVQRSLLDIVARGCREAREATSEYSRDTAMARAHGAITLAYYSDVIDQKSYNALWDLASNARSQRATEMIYDQKPYTGAQFAESRWKSGKAAA
ncbi:hypothetical protein HBO32_07555 [Pseudomonas nitroreducens]|uniref:hypothetical protein n=1 Tax=Pseudomonas TaxID=286 RepID=UPI0007EE7746|nr:MULTISPECIES: hypothetical protein [Pseudomonas]NMZ72950.1 hypothetical protein [Pseudomonas nitroreducens]OBY59441.1 hypothetical protein A9513_028995 [Pseudomonas sp. AU12215]